MRAGSHRSALTFCYEKRKFDGQDRNPSVFKATDGFLSGMDPNALIAAARRTLQANPSLAPNRDYAIDWKEHLMVSDRGAVQALLANAVTAFREAPEWAGVLGYDEFACNVVALKAPPWGKLGPWTDQEDRLANIWLQREGITVKLDVAGQAVQTVALEHGFHPVKTYLDSLVWDQTRRLDTWLSLYLGVQHTEYSSSVGSRFLISCVARIYKPGCKVDTCLILEGPQGKGKSRSLRALAEPYFADEIADLGSKDAAMQTRGVWLIEIAELDSMSRSEIGKVKAFMSRETDRFRPPYGKRLIESARQCVFAGSVNHNTYLRDETGGRRFWPVTCGEIRLKDLERDRDQLWAEAIVRYRSGAPWWLDTRSLSQIAEDEQAARYEGDAWDGRIAAWLRYPKERFDSLNHPVAPFSSNSESVTIPDILSHCLEKPVGQWTQVDANRVSRSLRALNWERFQVRDDNTGKREWRFRQVVSGNGSGRLS
jgi:Virulence-associated protein E